MNRFLSSLTAILLCSSMLGGCASLGMGSAADGSAPDKSKQLSALEKTPPTDLDGGVRQAQLLRVAGKYDEAIHILSQLMLVASDDPRVVGEYGKTLAEQGRAQDAVQFLNRASELQSGDWTIYSALGVAYDQLSDQASAKIAYEHALALKPDEPSVLNNYALSRMLANDPQTARQLMERAQIAGGAKDAKIARNIAMVNSLVPAPAAPMGLAYAVQKPAPEAPAIVTAPLEPFMSAMPPTTPTAPPRPLAAANPPDAAARIVMQQVPIDPLAGPVQVQGLANARPVATHPPRVLADPAAQKAAATAAESVVKQMIAQSGADQSVGGTKAAKKDGAAGKLADRTPAPRGALDKAAPVKALAQNAPQKNALQKNASQKAAPPSLRLAAD